LYSKIKSAIFMTTLAGTLALTLSQPSTPLKHPSHARNRQY
jgi:hypothetical protein